MTAPPTDWAPPDVPRRSDGSVAVASRRRALGAGLGFLVVVLAYDASRFEDPDRWWAAGLTIVIGTVLADALVDVRRLLPTPGVAPLTIVAALGAVVLCVPETDQLPIVALLPVAVVGVEVVQRRQLELEWYAVAAAAVGWGAMFGASGRQSALVGALFAWWPVLLLAFVGAVWRVRSTSAAVFIAGVGAVAAAVVARTGGIADRWAVVVVSVAVGVAGSLLVAATIARFDGSARPGDGTDQVSERV